MAEVPIVRYALAGAILTLISAGSAAAQTLESNSSSYNGGYGRVNGQENRPVAYGTRDANGNRVIIDGLIQTGVDQSSYSRQDGGSWSDGGGVGSQTGTSTAIGNNLVVITQGNWNTVIVTSVQTNTGDVTAGVTSSGGN